MRLNFITTCINDEKKNQNTYFVLKKIETVIKCHMVENKTYICG